MKATSQRIAIRRYVMDSREHPTAQRVYEGVKKVHLTVSLATVYKTLSVLEKLNLVQELAFAKGETRFDSFMEPHINLVCRRCGSVADVDDIVAREMVVSVTREAGFSPTGQRIDIYGICARCSARRTRSISTLQ